MPWEITSKEVEGLHAAGIRGVRCNIVDRKEGKGVLPLDELKKLGKTIKAFGWHVEFLMHVDEFPDLDRSNQAWPRK